MVHNMLVPLQNMDEIYFWDNIPFSGVMPEPQRTKPGIKKPIKKKIKRNRTAFTTKQLRTLEIIFSQNKYITPERRREISKSLNLGDKSVKIWFQNRRMKEKRESSESSRVDSDSSNENCCEMSLPSTVSTESYKSHQNENTVIPQNESLISQSCQYQVPNFSVNNMYDQQIPYYHTNDYNTVQVNQMQYYNESNMYPTQYYPYNDSNYSNDYNYYQYHQENSMNNSYWTSNYIASCQFYSE